MGLFQFLKNVGAKIFTGDAKEKTETKDMSAMAKEMMNTQRAIALKTQVAQMGLPIENFDIVVDGDKASVYGQTTSQANKEKIVLTVGNTEGIAFVEDNISVTAAPEPQAEFYEVKKGDSLSKIAKRYYGNALKYPVIFEANRPMLKDPNLIYPGQMLRIPSLEATA